jgi:hypothetical protein
MAKNYKLIPGENNNWEIAAFLLIDHLYIPNSKLSHIEFSRSDMHSSTKALDFIEKLLGAIGYVVDKTLSNSISSAITMLERNGYLICAEGDCRLTDDGFNRLQQIKDRYTENNIKAVGKNRKVFQVIENLDPETRQKVLKKFNELSVK